MKKITSLLDTIERVKIYNSNGIIKLTIPSDMDGNALTKWRQKHDELLTKLKLQIKQ